MIRCPSTEPTRCSGSIVSSAAAAGLAKVTVPSTSSPQIPSPAAFEQRLLPRRRAGECATLVHPLGDVLAGADETQRIAVCVEVDLPAAVEVPDRPVGSQDPVLEVVVLVTLEGRLHVVVDPVAILGMDRREPELIGRLDRLGLVEEAIGLLRPDHRVGRDMPLPDRDAGDLLGVGELGGGAPREADVAGGQEPAAVGELGEMNLDVGELPLRPSQRRGSTGIDQELVDRAPDRVAFEHRRGGIVGCADRAVGADQQRGVRQHLDQLFLCAWGRHGGHLPEGRNHKAAITFAQVFSGGVIVRPVRIPRVIEQLVDQIESRFGELERDMSDPDVIADRERYAAVGREYSELEGAIALAREWRN